MSRTLITTARPITMRARPNRFVAAGLAAFIAAGGGAIASSVDDPVAPTRPSAAADAPIVLGDPPTPKGARGATPTPVVVQVFGDPTVHKGAGGR